MFDILYYLFESYATSSRFPQPKEIVDILLEEGFDESDVSEAMEWLAGMSRAVEVDISGCHPSQNAFRFYPEEERRRFHSTCFPFLAFMERIGALDAPSREIVIERALALKTGMISVSRLKLITLMLLWQRRQPLSPLLVEELLTDRKSRQRINVH